MYKDDEYVDYGYEYDEPTEGLTPPAPFEGDEQDEY